MLNPIAVDTPAGERVGIGRQAIEVLLGWAIAFPVMLLANARIMAFAMVVAIGIGHLLSACHLGDRRRHMRRWEHFRDTLISAPIACLVVWFFPSNQAIFQGIRPLSTLLHRLGY
ncbi:MAG: hypothetical protein HZA61_01200 [Candidatus Eisenbacteria bacterium]|uniref:Uncharacterized protein n=1 Tax=Eiseniibacteriota bacterium TaxID=2212470 RepID=A0A933S9N5_UNCEI|nr:hypothetical protein [Candidatus Eisenbacteria bacterium]